MIEINLTIIVQVVQFLILVFVLNRLLFRPIGRVMGERQQKITGWEEETRRLHETVRSKLESYENQLQEAKAQARGRQEQMTGALKEKEEQRLREVSEEAARQVAETHQRLQEETEQLRKQLRRETTELSQVVTEKVLGRKVS